MRPPLARVAIGVSLPPGGMRQDAAAAPAVRARTVLQERARAARWLIGALGLLVIALMLGPIAASALSSLKAPAEAAASPPHFLPATLSFANYAKVFHYQAGLATYLFNSFSVALLTVCLCLLLAVPAGFGLGRAGFGAWIARVESAGREDGRGTADLAIGLLSKPAP